MEEYERLASEVKFKYNDGTLCHEKFFKVMCFLDNSD